MRPHRILTRHVRIGTVLKCSRTWRRAGRILMRTRPGRRATGQAPLQTRAAGPAFRLGEGGGRQFTRTRNISFPTSKPAFVGDRTDTGTGAGLARTAIPPALHWEKTGGGESNAIHNQSKEPKSAILFRKSIKTRDAGRQSINQLPGMPNLPQAANSECVKWQPRS